MMKLRYFLPFLALSATLRTTAAEPPRLVVQIVVSSMRAEDLNRYADNFSDEGFLRLVRGGTFYPESHYDYLHTSTPVSLATLTTGANPSVHGIVAERWIDYVNNNVVELIKDRSAMGIDCDAGIGDCSPRNLVAPTLGESLQQSSPKSLVATVALDPASAVVAGGYTRNVFWMDAPRANWITSSFYAETLPVWARKYNLSREILGYIPFAWELKYPRERYRNSQSTVIDLNKPEHLRRKRHRLTSVEPEKPAPNVPSGIERMLYTPSGNAVTLAFAKQLLTQMRLGKDTAPDLLNICLDAPRRIAESYGPESIEVEDMYYRLDEELAQFLNYLYAQIAPEEVVVVLTSDHGTSPSYDAGIVERDRFNAAQFQVIVNSFLCAQHGPGEWSSTTKTTISTSTIRSSTTRGSTWQPSRTRRRPSPCSSAACRTRCRRRPCGRATSAAATARRCRTASIPAVRATWWSTSCPVASRSGRTCGRNRDRCTATTLPCRSSSTAAASPPAGWDAAST